jgi:hypothetical protein
MNRCWLPCLLATISAFLSGSVLSADEVTTTQRRPQALEFHVRALERTGVLVPMYIYPADIHKNAAYNRLMDLKRQYPAVPMWVILNPASGPGKEADENYTRAIDRLRGAGCMVLGYVTTSYAKRPEAEVRKEIDLWLKIYPRIQGIFFDEMTYKDADTEAKYQAALNQYAHEAGCWPTVANPGADTPGRYFAAGAADVILIHEGDVWPTEERLKGDYFGGYADYPQFSRGILLHSQAKLDRGALRIAAKYVRWIYVTEAVYQPNDAKLANPWSRLSKHLETLCELLAEK